MGTITVAALAVPAATAAATTAALAAVAAAPPAVVAPASTAAPAAASDPPVVNTSISTDVSTLSAPARPSALARGIPAAVSDTQAAPSAAAYFAEADQKRAAADAAIAAVSDPIKLAAVNADAFKLKPSTTIGRLIKAANNSRLRAEREAAREAAGGAPRAGPSAHARQPGGGSPAAAAAGAASWLRLETAAGAAPALLHSAAGAEMSLPFMERMGGGSGPGAFEFRPPLRPSASVVASSAFAAAKFQQTQRESLRGSNPDCSGVRGGGGNVGEAAASGAAERGATAGTGIWSWGDGGRALAGDEQVARWLQCRGWGEYAAAFAANGVTRASLPALSMQDLENFPVEGGNIRAAMHEALSSIKTARDLGEVSVEGARTTGVTSPGAINVGDTAGNPKHVHIPAKPGVKSRGATGVRVSARDREKASAEETRSARVREKSPAETDVAGAAVHVAGKPQTLNP